MESSAKRRCDKVGQWLFNFIPVIVPSWTAFFIRMESTLATIMKRIKLTGVEESLYLLNHSLRDCWPVVFIEDSMKSVRARCL